MEERRKRKRSEDAEQEGGRAEQEVRRDAGHVEQKRLSVGWVDLPVDDASARLHAGRQTADSVMSAEYWRELCPWLHVNDDRFMETTKTWMKSDERSVALLKEEKARNLRDQMLFDGYFKDIDVRWPFKVTGLAEGIATLVRFGWHPIWIVMYDEAWLLAYGLHFLMKRVVSPNLQFNADYWAWYINPSRQEKGWEPHRDRSTMPFNADEEPSYVTAWIPLTDATPENGCIYIIPGSFDTNYRTEEESTEFDVQDIRALPAPAGSVLAWGGRTIHFGGRASSRATLPRIALSMAFSTTDFEDPWLRLNAPDKEGTKLETCDVIPPSTLRERLSVIATQHYLYEEKVPLVPHIRSILQAMEEDLTSCHHIDLH